MFGAGGSYTHKIYGVCNDGVYGYRRSRAGARTMRVRCAGMHALACTASADNLQVNAGHLKPIKFRQTPSGRRCLAFALVSRA